MDQKQRMLAGLPYKAWMDGLAQERNDCKAKIHTFNHMTPDQDDKKEVLLHNLLGSVGENAWIESPFHCDYGWNIHVGKNFFANYNLVILDVGTVTIGDNVLMGPNVSIYTAGHPVHPDSRNTGYEYGIPITIRDSVWIGGNVVILPGVTIGSGTVVAAGSVVTKDLPDNVIAAGNPCRILRKITEDDRKYYFRNQEFDVPIE